MQSNKHVRAEQSSFSNQHKTQPRFVRRTMLHPDEYRKNFKQTDIDVLAAVASDEACAVTPSMNKIYTRLMLAPSALWERDGVLHLSGCDTETGEHLTAWKQLIHLTGVGNTTAKKALDWMHEQGIIGYSAIKNGVGIRIFFNRAASSIGKTNLRLVPAPTGSARVPTVGTPFKDSKAVLDVLDNVEIVTAQSAAPEPSPTRADCVEAADASKPTATKAADNSEPAAAANLPTAKPTPAETRPAETRANAPTLAGHQTPASDGSISNNELLAKIAGVVADVVDARLNANNDYLMERFIGLLRTDKQQTRDWLEDKIYPQMARVAAKTACDVWRSGGSPRTSQVSAGTPTVILAPPSEQTAADVSEDAASCLAMLETQGKPIEQTLAEYFTAEEAERVSEFLATHPAAPTFNERTQEALRAFVRTRQAARGERLPDTARA